ncbi:Thiol-disulfide oxidoreductase ResA [Aquisphaera giovannonii]|uniref:Thiol-disulfide oxidoreductase ResA n=1 Tax=Aquisphaera giovannonii TaxID=406548 RepID=A0A5B9W8X3_9BACT|nr:redoxin domain-containing protein [Aquisphaera giovannonii]QEH36847.1 Thiol-disulfide oxidoreductase ResA [Aquisphaera giovannonii]
MRLQRGSLCLLVSLPMVSGCSQPGVLRTHSDEGFRTVASVGDRPLATREGAIDSSVQAAETPPIVSSKNAPRISGRVFDERGKPVPEATVRLGVGGEAGGKAVTAVTDRSGAFTLRGVRAGSTYTVIARHSDEEGGTATGRVEVRVPDTDVRITLKPPSASRGDDRSSMRPARPTIAPASNVEEVEDEEAAPGVSSQVNPEDLDAPAPEAEAVRARKPRRGTPRLSIPTDEIEEPQHRGVRAPSGGGDEADENPLPPALDPPDQTSDARRSADESVVLTGRDVLRGDEGGKQPLMPRWSPASSQPVSTEASASAEADPRPLPAGLVPDDDRPTAEEMAPAMASAVAPDARSLMSGPPPVARRPGRPSRLAVVEAEPVASLPPRPSRESGSVARSRPTWGELALEKQSIPLDESLLKAAVSTRPAKAPNGPQPTPPDRAARTAAAASPTQAGISCDFDRTENRVRDLRLPDTQGRMVSLRDFDADLILLDFWGTNCPPCLTAIPHLNDIQKTFGGKRVQVIGIACEQTPAKTRNAKVIEVARRLKIAYPVLVTTMDGTCPVQEALQVQYLPTMVLLDRQGKVLRREQGANEQALARMDRFILRGLGRQIPWNLDGPDTQIVGAPPKSAAR